MPARGGGQRAQRCALVLCAVSSHNLRRTFIAPRVTSKFQGAPALLL